MGAYSKTQGIEVLAHQAVAHPLTVKGAAQDVTTKISATIAMFHASVEAVENTNPGKFLVQISASSSGDEDWVTITEFTPQVSTADTETMTATEAGGETVLAVSSTTGFASEQILYIQDTGTLTDSEWARCQEIVTDTSIDLIDGLTNGKDSSDVIWNDAEIFYAQIDLASIGRLRVVFQHEGGTGADVHVKALMVTGDSFA